MLVSNAKRRCFLGPIHSGRSQRVPTRRPRAERNSHSKPARPHLLGRPLRWQRSKATCRSISQQKLPFAYEYVVFPPVCFKGNLSLLGKNNMYVYKYYFFQGSYPNRRKGAPSHRKSLIPGSLPKVLGSLTHFLRVMETAGTVPHRSAGPGCVCQTELACTCNVATATSQAESRSTPGILSGSVFQVGKTSKSLDINPHGFLISTSLGPKCNPLSESSKFNQSGAWSE